MVEMFLLWRLVREGLISFCELANPKKHTWHSVFMGVTSEDSTNHGSKKKLGRKTYAVAGTYEAVRPRMVESALTTYRLFSLFLQKDM